VADAALFGLMVVGGAIGAVIGMFLIRRGRRKGRAARPRR